MEFSKTGKDMSIDPIPLNLFKEEVSIPELNRCDDFGKLYHKLVGPKVIYQMMILMHYSI